MAAIVQQLAVSDQLIEQRMKFEDLFVQVNQLPQYDVWTKFEELGGEKFGNARADAEKALSSLFNDLIVIEQTLDKANPDLLKKNSTQSEHNTEEETEDLMSDVDQGFEEPEIADEDRDYLEYADEDDDEDNDEDNEENNEEDENDAMDEIKDHDSNDIQMQDACDSDDQNDREIVSDINLTSLNERNSFNPDGDEYLAEKHQNLNLIRNEILEFWFQKTRYTLKAGKLDKNALDSFEQSTVRSIEHALQNRLKLIRRTQLKRSKYQIIGCSDVDEEEPKSELVERKAKEVYNTEIFDDSDFYHQLLRELIGNLGPTTTNASTKVNPKWLKLMKERFKTKKSVDTKATKARKIRYKVHDELVNFMTPMAHLCTYNPQELDYFYKGIFGNRPTEIDDNEDEDVDSDDE